MSEPAPTALVVDDDESLRWAYALELIARGYAVAEASDGKEALDLFSRGERFNLVISDLNMPVIDGASFIVELVERGYTFDAVILATAADPNEPVIEHVRTAISGQFLFFVYSKSAPIDRLYEILSEIKKRSTGA